MRGPDPLGFRERMRHSMVWLLMAGLAAFLAWRIAQPGRIASRVRASERAALVALRTIHRAQVDAYAEAGACLPLARVFDRHREELAGFSLETVEGVDLLRGHRYLIALWISAPADSAQDSDRIWNAKAPVGAGMRGYGAYAWPEKYGRESQWAFFVDHRGRLLGGWNHNGLLDGTSAPFPPTVNPLYEYNLAVRRGEDGEWFLFEDLGEVGVHADE